MAFSSEEIAELFDEETSGVYVTHTGEEPSVNSLRAGTHGPRGYSAPSPVTIAPLPPVATCARCGGRFGSEHARLLHASYYESRSRPCNGSSLPGVMSPRMRKR